MEKDLWTKTCGQKPVDKSVDEYLWTNLRTNTCGRIPVDKSVDKSVDKYLWANTCGQLCGQMHVAKYLWTNTCGQKPVDNFVDPSTVAGRRRRPAERGRFNGLDPSTVGRGDGGEPSTVPTGGGSHANPGGVRVAGGDPGAGVGLGRPVYSNPKRWEGEGERKPSLSGGWFGGFRGLEGRMVHEINTFGGQRLRRMMGSRLAVNSRPIECG